MQCCDGIFREIRDGALPSTAIARLVAINPQVIDILKDLNSPTQRSSMKLVDELFSKQRLVGPFSMIQTANIYF